MGLKAAKENTEIGPLPSDWQVLPLGTLARAIQYGSSAPSRATGTVPVLRMGNLQDGKVDWSDLVFTSDAAEIRRYELSDGDVLFNRTNTIDLVGKTSIYRGERKAIFAGYLIRVLPAPDKLDARYLNYVMNTEAARRHSAKVLSVAVGQANINGQKLRTYPIPLPPTLTEQRAIATALSDFDDLLAGLDRLITKKRDLKQAAMQQLLSGRTRLPGFRGQWVTKELREVATCLRGVSYSGDSDLAPHDTPHTKRLLRANNVQDGVVILSDLQYVNAARVKPIQILRTGDILVCMANGSRALVGKAGHFTNGDGFDYTFGAFMGCLRVDAGKCTPKFVYYLLQSQRYRDYLGVLLAGSTINNLRPSAVESLHFEFPEQPEQSAIATVLSDMEVEIAALEARREKTRALKQAMMQELLTGRTRLV